MKPDNTAPSAALHRRVAQYLHANKDERYAQFQRRLIPTLPAEMIIGVRTPVLRSFAQTLFKECSSADLETFFHSVPHRTFEENQLHAFLICATNDFPLCMERLEFFLPYLDNWATCDGLSPPVFKKNSAALLPAIERWLGSGRVYTTRFAIGMLMRYFLDNRHAVKYARRVAEIRSGEYYINMMRAWYFATALAVRYDEMLPFIEKRRLDRWTHNKTIQKAVESFRITAAQKSALRALRWK